MNNTLNDTLSAWGLIESLNPLEIDDKSAAINGNAFVNGESQLQFQSFNEFYKIWDDPKFIISNNDKRKIRKYKFLRKTYPKYQLEKIIKEIFSDDKEIFNQSQKTCYSYHFQIDSDGHYIDESVHVPMIMTALKELKKDKNSNIEDIHEANFSRFKHEFNEIFADRLVTEIKLEEVDIIYSKYFIEIPYKLDYRFHNHYVEVGHVNKDQEEMDFNSFYLSDIESAKDNVNETLKKYINGISDDIRIEVDENTKYIEHILSPENLPDGRWPSLVEHKLSLMQQVAVNQITNSNDNILSVNGPPGTGKTTLLKDIFAHIVVERAKKMADLKDPKEAFHTKKIREGDQYPVHFVNPDLTHYKMVVASSNNGAVENISKDLPKLDEIIRNSEKDSQYPDYEARYREAMMDLDSFKLVGSELIDGEESWGIFSGVFGRASNINKVINILLSKNKKDGSKFNVLLESLNNSNEGKSWETIVNEFKSEQKIVNDLKKELNIVKKKHEKVIEDYPHIHEIKHSIHEMDIKINTLKDKIESENKKLETSEREIERLTEKIESRYQHINDIKDSRTIIEKTLSLFKEESQEIKNEKIEINNFRNEKEKYQDNSHNVRKEINDLESSRDNFIKDLENQRKQVENYNREMEELYSFKEDNPGLIYPDADFWYEDNYDSRQENTLWITDKLQYHRGQLFIKALTLQKSVLVNNAGKVHSVLFDFERRNEYIDSEPSKVENAWNLIHLIFPVISTTFASFGRMYKSMPKDFIDYLFVDEAGQAVPQAAVGAMMRSKRAIVVGDPIQIEPVVTLEKNLIDLVRKKYNIPERLLCMEASVQSLSDTANQYGYLKGEGDDKEWIGIPLWVHRRCLNPMFTISNQIAYENKMVLPSYVKNSEEKGKTGEGNWYHSEGIAKSKQYVREHSMVLIEHLKNHWISAKNKGKAEPSVFVISPFTAVKSNIIKDILKSNLDQELGVEKKILRSWVNRSIGTVHTFQGKEADTVYFVIGTDRNQEGAVNWSCSKPNLLNVAVTRAKKAFYLIGDKERIRSKNFYNVIDKEIDS